MDETTQESFDSWATPRAPALLRFAYLVTGDQHAAEDAVQAALASAFETWPRVRSADNPDGYVRRMIVNAHVSRWRRFGRRESPVPDVHLPDVPDRADGVASSAAVWAACADLPVKQRAAIVLRYYEDLDYAEIARVLDCAEATARSHVHRALATLRTGLDREDFHA